MKSFQTTTKTKDWQNKKIDASNFISAATSKWRRTTVTDKDILELVWQSAVLNRLKSRRCKFLRRTSGLQDNAWYTPENSKILDKAI